MFEEHLIKVSPFNLEPKECCDILEIAENTTAWLLPSCAKHLFKQN